MISSVELTLVDLEKSRKKRKKGYVLLLSVCSKSHFVPQPARKKTKAEVMAEVMAKSKEHKVGPFRSPLQLNK